MTPNPHDQAIDDTLTALRGVEAPLGLEQRILQSLDRKAAEFAAEPRRPGLARLLPAWRPSGHLLRRAALGSACALLLAAGTVTAFHHKRPSSTASVHAPVPAPPSDAASVAAVATPHPPFALPARHRHAPRAAIPVAPRVGEAPAPPPAPLTEQERLLQQIARHGDAGQIAMLNPDFIARQEAQSDAEFRQFFAPTAYPNRTSNP